MKKIFKNLSLAFIMIFTIMLFPKDVFAEDVTVKVRDGGPLPEATIVATFTAVKDDSSIRMLKEKLQSDYNINLDDYVFLNSWSEEANDNAVICRDEGYDCYSMDNAWVFYFDLAPIDHTEKKISLNSVPATSNDLFFNYIQINYDKFQNYGNFTTCNSTYTKCTFVNTGTYKAYDNVVISYNYDKEIYAVAKKIIDSGLLNKNEFYATDVELLHFLNYGGSLASYTSEFKNQLDNKNFDFDWDQRAGGNDPLEFMTSGAGYYTFLYKGVVCYVKERIDIFARHIIYVPSDANDVLQAIKDRLNDIFGNDLQLTVTKSTKTINEALAAEGLDTVGEDGNDYFYIITNTNEPDEAYYFKAIKDSSKINNNISFKSSDLMTKVEVSTDENIPLDTKVDVDKITSGDTYNKIIKAIDVSNGEMFEINLLSNGQDKRITKLDNGKFKVRIPIPKKYLGKTLKIFYVDEEKKVTPYTVKVVKDKDGNSYAEFETDHFSIYTLAEVENGEPVPKTFDSITYYIILLVISTMSIITITIYKIKTN